MVVIDMVIKGYRSVEEALKARGQQVQKLLIPQKPTTRESALADRARSMGIVVEKARTPTEEIAVFLKSTQRYIDFDVLKNKLSENISNQKKQVVLILDGITDAHNLGAILRSAAFFGIDGVVLPKDRAAEINDTVARIASGGVEYVDVAQVVNLVQAIEDLKEIGFWSVGFSEHSRDSLSTLKCDFSAAIIIGNEEKGMRPLVKDHCDHLVKIEGAGGLISLNASVAAALAMEWSRRNI